MAFIERVNEKSIFIRCNCGEGFNQNTETFDPQLMEEFGQYQNLVADPCPNCGMIHIFNMNLPETEFADQELEEEPYFPEGEKEHRESVRGFMWKKRNDLKGKDYEQEKEKKKAEVEKKFGKGIDEIKKEFVDKARKKRGGSVSGK